jgi:Ca-activated chloride channel family protein
MADERQTPCSRILFILDASYSMVAKWESGRKIDVSKRIIGKIIDSLERYPNVQVALRVYGHQKPVPPQDCSDTKLEVPFSQGNHQALKDFLFRIQPRGTTPIARSLEEAANDFPDDNCRHVIILLTDGIESCDGDPCAVSLELQRRGIVLEPFVVGIGLDVGFRRTFECVGKFYDAVNESKFDEIMGIIITQALNTTSAQVNLLDAFELPTGTNVNMTFYDRKSNAVRYNYLHTLNYRGNPDTLFLDPGYEYRAKIHTLPPIWIDSVVLQKGIHNVFAVNASMGHLVIKDPKGVINQPVKVLVKQLKGGETVHIQNIGEKVQYLAGDYQLDILTTPTITIDSVNIRQSHTTTVDIPRPGIVNFVNNSEGQGGIYKHTPEGLIMIQAFPDNMRFFSITLQPGKYMAMFRPIGKQETLAVIKREFEVKQGEIIRVLLY